MSQSTTTSSGIGFFGVLTIVFIILKILGYIDWSWWLVLLPLIIPLAVALVCIGIFIIIFLIANRL